MKEDKDKAIIELLNSMNEEYIKGAKSMLNHLRERVTGCYGKGDGCSICEEGNNFLKQEVKKYEEHKVRMDNRKS